MDNSKNTAVNNIPKAFMLFLILLPAAGIFLIEFHINNDFIRITKKNSAHFNTVFRAVWNDWFNYGFYFTYRSGLIYIKQYWRNFWLYRFYKINQFWKSFRFKVFRLSPIEALINIEFFKMPNSMIYWIINQPVKHFASIIQFFRAFYKTFRRVICFKTKINI